MDDKTTSVIPDRESLIHQYKTIRNFSLSLCEPLETDDFQVQSIIQTSPPKWHIAHVSWFFETFLLKPLLAGYKAFDDRYDYLFNSYYYTHGRMHARPNRGLLSRPTVQQILAYRKHVDRHMETLLANAESALWPEISFRVLLGNHHEQQHQELLLMDVKHNFFTNPLKPAYRDDLDQSKNTTRPIEWVYDAGGINQIGHDGIGFAFDNETPRHNLILHPHRLADRLTTNSEYLGFIEDGGYSNPALWLADGWALLQQEHWNHPLYWIQQDQKWRQFTLGGVVDLDPDEPVCHVSFYEADAYARWLGKRLPREEEIEHQVAQNEISGNFVEQGALHPKASGTEPHWYGDLWTWTASPYQAYPGFKPLDGTMGEYNGKFMANQMVLRGGSCATSINHIRPSYRNFFYPDERWAFTGIRLAEDA